MFWTSAGVGEDNQLIVYPNYNCNYPTNFWEDASWVRLKFTVKTNNCLHVFKLKWEWEWEPAAKTCKSSRHLKLKLNWTHSRFHAPDPDIFSREFLRDLSREKVTFLKTRFYGAIRFPCPLRSYRQLQHPRSPSPCPARAFEKFSGRRARLIPTLEYNFAGKRLITRFV